MISLHYRTLCFIAVAANILQLATYSAWTSGALTAYGGGEHDEGAWAWLGGAWQTGNGEWSHGKPSTSTPARRARVGRGAMTGGECGMCTVAPELCDTLGERALARSIAFAGSNDRLWRVLAKMEQGEPWVMASIGGSVSKGFGINWGSESLGDLPVDPKYRQPNMHRLIFDHLDALYPAPLTTSADDGANRSYAEVSRESGVNSMVNDAQGGTGSGYFSHCFAEHVPRDADIIFVELGINDELLLSNYDSYELLVRSLLDLPNKPAIIYVEIFALLFRTMSMGADLHRGINQFYDIPTISLRNAVLPQVLRNSSMVPLMFTGEAKEPGSLEGLDLRHLSHHGHRLMADLVTAYIDTQRCAMRPSIGGVDEYPIDEIPRLRLMQQYDTDTVLPILEPMCQSMTSTVHRLSPSRNNGWREWNWKEKKYMIADKPGSTVSFPFSTVLGQVQLQYQRSKLYGLGNAHCWVEGYKSTLYKYIEGYWEEDFNIVQQAAIDNVPPGDHELTCFLLTETGDPAGGTEFRIVSVTSI